MRLSQQADAIRARLLRADEGAAGQARAMSALSAPEAAQVLPLLREYVRLKYMLLPQDMDLESLEALGRRSLERVAVRGNQVPGMDVSPHCGSASSATHKKVLLLLALRRDLEIHISPADGARCETLEQLASCVSEQLRKKAAGAAAD